MPPNGLDGPLLTSHDVAGTVGGVSTTVQEIEREALALPPDQRAQLVDKLWDSLGDTTYPALSQSWIAEIERRRKQLAEGQAKSVPGEEVSRHAWEIVGQTER